MTASRGDTPMVRPGEETSTLHSILQLPYNTSSFIFFEMLDSAGRKQLEARPLSPSETAAISSEVVTLMTGGGRPADVRDDSPSAKQTRWRDLVGDHGGTPNALVYWAVSKFGDTPQGRDALLKAHREEFGHIAGISETKIRELRRKLVSESKEGSPLQRSARGGAGMHKKRRT
jgi:hypothetical protein